MAQTIAVAAPRGWISTVSFCGFAVVGYQCARNPELDSQGGIHICTILAQQSEVIPREFARKERMYSMLDKLKSGDETYESLMLLSSLGEHPAFASAAAPIFRSTIKTMLGCFSSLFRNWKVPVMDDPEFELFQIVMNQPEIGTLRTECANFFSRMGYPYPGVVKMAKWILENCDEDARESGYELLEKSWEVEPLNLFKLNMLQPEHLENYYIDTEKLRVRAMEGFEQERKMEVERIINGKPGNPLWCAGNVVLKNHIDKRLKETEKVKIKTRERRELERAATHVGIGMVCGLIWGVMRGSFRAWQKNIDRNRFLRQHLWKSPVGTGLLIAMNASSPYWRQSEFRYESVYDDLRAYATDAAMLMTYGVINWFCPYAILFSVVLHPMNIPGLH